MVQRKQRRERSGKLKLPDLDDILAEVGGGTVKLYVKVKRLTESEFPLIIGTKSIEFTKAEFSFDNQHWFDHLLEAFLAPFGLRLQLTQVETTLLNLLMTKTAQQASVDEKIIEFDFPKNFLKLKP